MTDGAAGSGDQHTPTSTDPVAGGGGEWDGRYTAAQSGAERSTQRRAGHRGRGTDHPAGCWTWAARGADAVWLASHGRHVTALDVSRVTPLERPPQAAVARESRSSGVRRAAERRCPPTGRTCCRCSTRRCTGQPARTASGSGSGRSHLAGPWTTHQRALRRAVNGAWVVAAIDTPRARSAVSGRSAGAGTSDPAT